MFRFLESTMPWLQLRIALACASCLVASSCGANISVSAPASTLDADSDGIEDAGDQCPSEPENYQGYQDEDGCPDRPICLTGEAAGYGGDAIPSSSQAQPR